jgi:hypothetical protein
MITIAAIKKSIDKALVWCRQHWRWLVLSSVALLAFLLGRKNSKTLRIQALLAKDQYKEESEMIEKAYKNKEAKKKRTAEKYKNSLKQLDKLYDNKSSILDREKDKEYRSLLEEAQHDPDKLDNLLEGLGIKEV